MQMIKTEVCPFRHNGTHVGLAGALGPDRHDHGFMRALSGIGAFTGYLEKHLLHLFRLSLLFYALSPGVADAKIPSVSALVLSAFLLDCGVFNAPPGE